MNAPLTVWFTFAPCCASQAQKAGGFGYATYVNTEQCFMGIQNIHAVRDSYKKLQALITDVSSSSDVTWDTQLAESGWLGHIRSIISASVSVAQVMHFKQCSTLIHCSDGWDRTAQVCSLAEMLMDPYYRTIEVCAPSRVVVAPAPAFAVFRFAPVRGSCSTWFSPPPCVHAGLHGAD